MANQTTDLTAELNAFAAPYIESGRFQSTADVMRAAMDAFRLSQVDEQALNRALLELAEEGEATGEVEGDIFEIVRAKYGLGSPVRK